MYRLNRGITGSWWLVSLNFYLALSIAGTTLLMIDPGRYKHTRTPDRVLFSVPGIAPGTQKETPGVQPDASTLFREDQHIT